MIRQYKLKLLFAMVAISIGATTPARAIAEPTSVSDNSSILAQLFYPPDNDRQIIAVVGQGYASVPADLAHITVALTNYLADSYRYPPKPDTSEPITEDALTNILNGLKATGVANDKIKVTIEPLKRRSAKIEIELEKPTKKQVDRIVKSVNSALPKKGDRNEFKLQDVDISVKYMVNNCEAVETAAYLAAVKDAKLRANALAKSIGVNLADVPSIAELPFLGRFWTSCSQEPDITDSIFNGRAQYYNPVASALDTSAEVKVYREIAVTYRIR